MSDTIAVSDVLGRQVVSVADAENVGEVRALVLDHQASRVERLQVAGRKRSAELVDWNRIDGVGPDAVMIKDGGDVHPKDDEDEPFVRGDIEIIGAMVLDTAGYDIGTVTDLHIDATTGEVMAAMTAAGRIPADRIRSLGTFALVVDPE